MITTAARARRANLTEQAIELRAQGLSLQSIADALGISRTTVRAYSDAAYKEFLEANKEKFAELVKSWHRKRPGYIKQWKKDNPEYDNNWRRENPEYKRQRRKQNDTITPE